MISCVSWIGRGRLAARPLQYELAPEAIDQLITKQQEMQLQDAEHEADGAKPYHDDDDDDDEDDEDDEEEVQAMEKLSQHIAGGDEEDDQEDADDVTHADAAAVADKEQPPAPDGEEQEPEADADSRMRDVPAPKGTRSRRRKRRERMDHFSAPDPEGDAVLAELRMDEYDGEPDGAELFLGGRKLTVHESNAADPYITVQDEEDDGSDDEDVVIRASDSVLCVGRTEQEHSAIELYVYDEDTGSLFVHHDFNLPSFPLCIQHVDCGPSVDSASAAASGAFLAVGTFLPGIEVWNLDVLDVLEPVCTLGGHEDGRVNISSSSRKGRLRELKPGSHEDAVLCMSWHAAHRERLASGSADETVKLWDLTTQQCTATLRHHKDRAAQPQPKAAKKEKKKQKGKKGAEAQAEEDESWYEEAQAANTSHKVQSIQFNPSEPSLLLTGSYDRTVQLIDVRLPAASSSSASRVYSVDSDVEMVRWHPHAALFLVATESGMVCLFDARQPSAPLFRLAAHDGAATSGQDV
jgi:periodic tryptophan protein 1